MRVRCKSDPTVMGSSANRMGGRAAGTMTIMAEVALMEACFTILPAMKAKAHFLRKAHLRVISDPSSTYCTTPEVRCAMPAHLLAHQGASVALLELSLKYPAAH
jgi:hypothetical protein